LVHVLSKELDS